MKQARLVKRQPPQRTCIVCREIGNKDGLIRLVRQSDGKVAVDEAGRLPGRGAYLCGRVACWQAASMKLEHALRIHLSPEAKESLLICDRGVAANKQPS